MTVVIGAGIIGTCAACYLAREGLDVVQVDRGQPKGEESGGNAGSLHVQLLSYDFGDRAPAGGMPAAGRRKSRPWSGWTCRRGPARSN